MRRWGCGAAAVICRLLAVSWRGWELILESLASVSRFGRGRWRAGEGSATRGSSRAPRTWDRGPRPTCGAERRCSPGHKAPLCVWSHGGWGSSGLALGWLPGLRRVGPQRLCRRSREGHGCRRVCIPRAHRAGGSGSRQRHGGAHGLPLHPCPSSAGAHAAGLFRGPAPSAGAGAGPRRPDPQRSHERAPQDSRRPRGGPTRDGGLVGRCALRVHEHACLGRVYVSAVCTCVSVLRLHVKDVRVCQMCTPQPCACACLSRVHMCIRLVLACQRHACLSQPCTPLSRVHARLSRVCACLSHARMCLSRVFLCAALSPPVSLSQ